MTGPFPRRISRSSGRSRSDVVVVVIVVVVVAPIILFCSGSRDPILKREVE